MCLRLHRERERLGSEDNKSPPWETIKRLQVDERGGVASDYEEVKSERSLAA